MSDQVPNGGKVEDDDFEWELVAESSFATLFPKYREKYLKECWPLLSQHFNDSYGVKAKLDLMEGSVTVTTTKKMKDPYTIIKAKDVVKLVCRGVPYPQAVKVLDMELACDIMKIGRLVSNRDRFVRRRQRLIGSSGSTLKAIELLTDCYILIQGNTVASIGPYKGLAHVRQIVEDCLTNNVHPVFNIKKLLIRKELEKNPDLAGASWDRFLPKIPKMQRPLKQEGDGDGQKQNKKKKVTKKEYTPFPPEQLPSKVDLQLESGEYFASQNPRDERRNKMRHRPEGNSGHGHPPGKKKFNKRR